MPTRDTLRQKLLDTPLFAEKIWKLSPEPWPITEAQLRDWLPADRDVEVYFLGTKPFMHDMKKALLDLGVPAPQLHWEFFGPAANIDV